MAVISHTVVPSSILSVPLPPHHRVSLHFLLPPLLHLIIYALELACSIALCCGLYHIDKVHFTGITAALIFLPALVTAIAILIRGSRETPLSRRVTFAIAISFIYPVWTVYRLSQRIFWAIEAMLILRRGKTSPKKDEENGSDWQKDFEEALEYSIEPSSAELYLFLRAFLFSLPNLFLHSCIIIAGSYDLVKGYETYMIETASIIFSLVYISMTAAYYQSFESNRLLGRNFPWRGKKKETPLENANKIRVGRAKEEKERLGLEQMPSLVEMKEENQRQNAEDQLVGNEENQTTENLITQENNPAENKEEGSQTEEKEVDEEQIEEKKTRENETDEKDSEQEELMKPNSPPSSPTSTCSSPPVILRRDFNFPGIRTSRMNQAFNIPVPNDPAPPPPRGRPPRIPGGFRDIFCDSDSSVTSPRVSRDQSFKNSLFGWTYTWRPNRFSRSNTADLNLPHTSVPQGIFPGLALPERQKDPPKILALERDDAIGLSISFCSWLFILLARMLTLGNGIYFFTNTTIGVCAGHVAFVAIWLLYREGRPYFQPRKLLLRFALALTSMSGLLLELGAQPFQRKAFFLHSSLIFIENLGLGLAWMLPIEFDSWWSSYAFYTALASHLISFACAILYTFALRPQQHVLPPKSLLSEAEIIR